MGQKNEIQTHHSPRPVGGPAAVVCIGASRGGKAHAHIGHVMTSWADTPDKAGFLPTAIAEAKITIQHVGLAAKDPGSLKKIKLHIGHVFNAIDPSIVKKKPGLGYGVLVATNGASKHLGFAVKSADVTDYVKLHAKHVSASTDNTIKRAEKIAALGKQVLTQPAA